MSCERGDEEMVKLLMRRGCDPFLRNEEVSDMIEWEILIVFD